MKRVQCWRSKIQSRIHVNTELVNKINKTKFRLKTKITRNKCRKLCKNLIKQLMTKKMDQLLIQNII